MLVVTCIKVSCSNTFLFYDCIKLFYFYKNFLWQNVIESLYWFECITVESSLCSDLKYIRQYTFFWNIFLNGGVFRTQSSILRWKPTQHFVKIVNKFQPLIIFAKRSMLDVWLGSEYASTSVSYFCVLHHTVALCNICRYFTIFLDFAVISLT